MDILAVLVFLVRESALSVEFGSNLFFIVTAALIFVSSIIMRIQLSKRLTMRVLTGFLEIAPNKYQNRPITEGIYAGIRHPRYVQALLAVPAYALFGNYLAVYLIFLIG